jgi:hypothetical protein
MEKRPWWPAAIVRSHQQGTLSTLWGSADYWWDEGVLSARWWNDFSDYWGEWPTNVESVVVLAEDQRGFLLDLGTHVARVCPIPSGEHISRLSRSPPLKSVLEQYMLLAVGGWSVDGDRILIFPHHDISSQPCDGGLLYDIHHALRSAGLSAPNMERSWNDRLNNIEAKLKSNTLWRAPHSKHMLAVVRLGVERTNFVFYNDRIVIRSEPISITEYLMDDGDRLPHLRDLAMIESENTLRQWLAKEEKNKVRNLFKTSTGGLALLRYDVTLCRLAEATAFGLEQMISPLREHLATVDRVQARLGLMRTCRMISLSSAVVIIFALMLWNIAEITTADRDLTLILSFPLMLIMRVLEWCLEPDWR